MHGQPVIMSLPGPGPPQPSTGASSVTITRPDKTRPCQYVEKRGRSQAAMFGKDFTEHRVMIMRTFRSRCLGISANVSTDVHVNFEASGRLTARTLSEITSSMIISVGC